MFTRENRVPLDSSSHGVTAVLIDASKHARRVRIKYLKSGPIESRVVQPREVFRMRAGSVKSTKADEVWVEAHCEKEHELRTFAVRRILSAEPIAEA